MKEHKHMLLDSSKLDSEETRLWDYYCDCNQNMLPDDLVAMLKEGMTTYGMDKLVVLDVISAYIRYEIKRPCVVMIGSPYAVILKEIE